MRDLHQCVHARIGPAGSLALEVAAVERLGNGAFQIALHGSGVLLFLPAAVTGAGVSRVNFSRAMVDSVTRMRPQALKCKTYQTGKCKARRFSSPVSQISRSSHAFQVAGPDSGRLLSFGFLNKTAGHDACSLGLMLSREKSAFRQRTERLQERTFEWASRILDLCPRLYPDDPSRVIWRQLIRASTSASGNLEEADEAFTDDDFLYRMKTIMRGTKKHDFGCVSSQVQSHERLGNLPDEAHQLASIFVTRAGLNLARLRSVELGLRAARVLNLPV